MTLPPSQSDSDSEESPAHRDELIDEIAQAPLYCARCHYNITGLRSPECPECGSPIDLEDCDSVTMNRPNVYYRVMGLSKRLFDVTGPVAAWGMIVGFILMVLLAIILLIGEGLG